MTTVTHTPRRDVSSGVAAPNSHPDTAPVIRGSFDRSTLVLSAMTAVVMVMVYQVLDSAAEDNWMLTWLALWAVAFGALAMLAGTARRVSSVMGTVLDRRASRVAARAARWAAAEMPRPGVTSLASGAVTPSLSMARRHALRVGNHHMRQV